MDCVDLCTHFNSSHQRTIPRTYFVGTKNQTSFRTKTNRVYARCERYVVYAHFEAEPERKEGAVRFDFSISISYPPKRSFAIPCLHASVQLNMLSNFLV